MENIVNTMNTELGLVVLISVMGATIIISIAAACAAFANSSLARTAIEAMARQPEARGPLLVNMLIAMGLIESIPIIAAVIAIILVLANPFTGLAIPTP